MVASSSITGDNGYARGGDQVPEVMSKSSVGNVIELSLQLPEVNPWGSLEGLQDAPPEGMLPGVLAGC